MSDVVSATFCSAHNDTSFGLMKFYYYLLVVKLGISMCSTVLYSNCILVG